MLTANLLSRPRIAAEVPIRLQPNPDQSIAALALLLLDAGVLRDCDLKRRRTWLANTCQKALAAWAAKHSEVLRIFKPVLSFRIGDQPYPGESSRKANDALPLHVEWYASEPQHLIVGPAIAHLENMHGGLGRTVIRCISYYGWRSVPVFTFDDQLNVASHCLWGGAENIDEYVESYGLEDDDAAQVRENCIDRHHILEHTPAWVFSGNGAHQPSDRALRRIAKRSPDAFCQNVVRALLELQATPPSADFMQDLMDTEGEFIGFGAVLRWSEADHTDTVLEALCDEALNSGVSFELCGYHAQPVDDVAGFRQWLAALTDHFASVRRLDALIAILADFNPVGAWP